MRCIDRSPRYFVPLYYDDDEIMMIMIMLNMFALSKNNMLNMLNISVVSKNNLLHMLNILIVSNIIIVKQSTEYIG